MRRWKPLVVTGVVVASVAYSCELAGGDEREAQQLGP